MWRRRLLKKGGAKRNAKKGEHDFQSVLEKIAKARKKAVPCAKGLGKVINGKVTASGENVGSSGTSSITGDQRM